MIVKNRGTLDPTTEDEFDHLHADLSIRLTSEHDDEGKHTPYEEYTVEWRAAGGPVVLGNGSLTGRFARRGTEILFWIEFVPGSSTLFSTGAWTFSLPVTPAYAFNALLATIADMDAALVLPATARNATLVSPDEKMVEIRSAAGALIDATTPITWASGDRLVIQGTYEGTEE